jgi:hypothetical protein
MDGTQIGSIQVRICRNANFKMFQMIKTPNNVDLGRSRQSEDSDKFQTLNKNVRGHDRVWETKLLENG